VTITAGNNVSVQDADLDITIDGSATSVDFDGDLVAGSTLTILNPVADALSINVAESNLEDINFIIPASGEVNLSPATGSGTYDLRGITSSGTITFDNLTANNTTAGISADLTAVQKGTTTGGGTVTVSAPAQTYTLNLPNIVDNSRFYLKNLNTGGVLVNATYVGGISITGTKDINYSAGDTLEGRVTYKNGATAKKEISFLITMPAVTTVNTIPVVQEDQETYNLYAKDGATVAGITWDSSNMEFDFDDADGKMPGQDIGAWYYDFIYTATGIAEAFGAFDWPQLNILTNKVAIASVEFDNVAVLPLQIQNCYVTKDNGSNIIKVGSAISIEPPAVFVASLTEIIDILEADEQVRNSTYQKLQKTTKAPLVVKNVIRSGNDIDLVEP